MACTVRTQPQRPARCRQAGRTILLVEDDPGLLGVLTLELERAGFRVLGFSSAEETLATLQSRPDLAVLDYRLPGLDGLGLLERLRCRLPRLPALIISSDCAVEKLSGKPLSRLLRKPFPVDNLLDSVDDLLHQ